MLTPDEAQMLVCIRRLLALVRKAFAPAATLQHILEELKSMSDTFDRELAQLRDDVAAQGTVIASATAAFRGLAAQLAAAEASAKAAGATDTQVASVTSMRQSLEANTASLAAAIPANTPVVPTSAPVTTTPVATTPTTTTPETTTPAATTTAEAATPTS